MARGNPTNSQYQHVLVDGHVHVHSCFDLRILLESAQRNFRDAARSLGIAGDYGSVLFLTESHGVNYFSSLRQKAMDQSVLDGWQFQATSEAESLVTISPRGFEITIIAGRQIVTAERLEVLATCTDALFDDGGKISEVIAAVSVANGVAIVPWGFGKWAGRRQKVIDRLIGEFAERPFHLGDNSGRLALGREPSQFARARSQQQRILRGTDPLPFLGQETRVGSFGFLMKGPFRRSEPTASIRNLLKSGNIQTTSFGALESPAIFVRHQLMMQARILRRRLRSNGT